MIEFMVIAAPRSATTWCANWLTTEKSLCLHDPLYQLHYSELDGLKASRKLGVSCTGLMWFPGWVNAHPARKIVLHRAEEEVKASMYDLGLPHADGCTKLLDGIEGKHYDWRDVFEKPREIYEYLLQMPFDAERHALLREIDMQPAFGKLKVNPEATRRLAEEVKKILH